MLHLQYYDCLGQTLSQEIKKKKLRPESLVAVVVAGRERGLTENYSYDF